MLPMYAEGHQSLNPCFATASLSVNANLLDSSVQQQQSQKTNSKCVQSGNKSFIFQSLFFLIQLKLTLK